MGCASKKYNKAEEDLAVIDEKVEELMVILEEIAKVQDKTEYNKLMAAWNADYMEMVAQRDAAWAVYWEYAPDEVIAENEAWKDRVFQRV
jgi:hypothetical protein